MTLSEMSGATFSADRVYRPLLWRRWDESLPWLNLIGCNPSKAGETESDPTITRQIERAKRLGYGGLLMTNANDLVATDPKEMKAHPKPLSPENDGVILASAELAHRSNGIIIAAWGKNIRQKRAERLIGLLANYELHCLGINKDGSPVHPLYVPYDRKPERWP